MPGPYINHFKNLYLIKTDKYKKSANNKNSLSNFSFNCLVMDYPSNSSWYENGRHDILSWRMNKIFYEIILGLAKRYPQINFLIKSKNYKWIDIHFYKKIVDTINQEKNISILNDKINLSANELINFADFAIAVTTSFAEEMLSLGKPVIIYNSYGGHPKKIFNYGERILASNFEEISKKINLIIEDHDNLTQSWI